MQPSAISSRYKALTESAADLHYPYAHRVYEDNGKADAVYAGVDVHLVVEQVMARG